MLILYVLPALQYINHDKSSSVKVIAGDAPGTEDFARQTGAADQAADASKTVSLTKSLIPTTD